MKKIICLLLCAVLLLSGCGREEPVPTTEPVPPTEVPTRPVVEIPMEPEVPQLKYAGVSMQYWSLLEETAPEAAVLRQAAEVFHSTTGADVTINWLSGDEGKLMEILSGDLQADLFEATGEGMKQQFLPYALDVTALAAGADYGARSWEKLRTQMTDRYGTLKAIALRPYLYGMYYNQDAFDQLGIEATPADWQAYLAFCQMLKNEGYEPLVIDDARANLILELHMERALGWDGLRDTMINSRWKKNEMAMTMIQEAISFAEAGFLVKGNPAVYPAGQNRLAQSNALLVVGSNVLCREVEADCLTDLDWGVFPYPGDGPGTGLLLDADVLAVNASSQNPEAAFEFAMLLATGEFDQLRSDVSEGIPADPRNSSPITGATSCMAVATAQAPKWFSPNSNELFSRLWNGYYKTGAYFADQLNKLARNFASEKNIG